MIPLRQVATLTIAASGLALAGPHRTSPIRERSEFLGATNAVHPGASCQVRGVWELVSVSQNGKDQPLAGYRGMKVLTDRHFMFVGHAAKRDTLPLKSEMDTLRAYQMSGGGGGHTPSGPTDKKNQPTLFGPRRVWGLVMGGWPVQRGVGAASFLRPQSEKGGR